MYYILYFQFIGKADTFLERERERIKTRRKEIACDLEHVHVSLFVTFYLDNYHKLLYIYIHNNDSIKIAKICYYD